MSACDIADRVDLHKAKLTDDVHQIKVACRGLSQKIGVEPKPPGRAVVDCQHSAPAGVKRGAAPWPLAISPEFFWNKVVSPSAMQGGHGF